MNFTKDEVLELLQNLEEFTKVEKILSTFIPAFENKTIEYTEGTFLHGSFNLAGPKSGRLSSQSPNLQQIPSTGTKYAKIIKECFKAPKGWLMIGADFNALEDRIAALLTKDPNRLKVYTDEFDGHCLRAYSYFHDQMLDIDLNSLDSINSIAEKYPTLRQKGKTPTFALQYGGTKKTLMDNCGFILEEADKIEKAYHRLYKESDKFIDNKLAQACNDGYVTLAFGLRLLTPTLARTIWSDQRTASKESHKEAKSAANALGGQSYCLLNVRADNEFMQRVWDSKWKTSILPIASIHDANYYMIKNNIECLHWANINLIECMQWNELPEIQHETVGLEGSLEVYYPDWAHPIKIPNKASISEILQITKGRKSV